MAGEWEWKVCWTLLRCVSRALRGHKSDNVMVLVGKLAVFEWRSRWPGQGHCENQRSTQRSSGGSVRASNTYILQLSRSRSESPAAGVISTLLRIALEIPLCRDHIKFSSTSKIHHRPEARKYH